MKAPPWSYSSLTSFETCPYKYYKTRVAKEVKEPEGEAAKWGTEVHKHLENRVKDETPLPDAIQYLEPIVGRVIASPGIKYTEQQLALDRDYLPVSWYDANAWARAIVDVTVINGTKAVTLDWKTGKRKPGSDQLKMSAAMLFHHYPEVETVNTGFVWIKEKKVDREQYSREDIPVIWQEFIPRAARVDKAFETDRWPKKPSGLCKAWCWCTDCEFCGRRS